MLLQNYDGTLFLLPALPDVWPSGSISGHRARGSIELDMTWIEGALATFTVRGDKAVTCRVPVSSLSGEGTVRITDASGQ